MNRLRLHSTIPIKFRGKMHGHFDLFLTLMRVFRNRLTPCTLMLSITVLAGFGWMKLMKFHRLINRRRAYEKYCYREEKLGLDTLRVRPDRQIYQSRSSLSPNI